MATNSNVQAVLHKQSRHVAPDLTGNKAHNTFFLVLQSEVGPFLSLKAQQAALHSSPQATNHSGFIYKTFCDSMASLTQQMQARDKTYTLDICIAWHTLLMEPVLNWLYEETTLLKPAKYVEDGYKRKQYYHDIAPLFLECFYQFQTKISNKGETLRVHIERISQFIVDHVVFTSQDQTQLIASRQTAGPSAYAPPRAKNTTKLSDSPAKWFSTAQLSQLYIKYTLLFTACAYALLVMLANSEMVPAQCVPAGALAFAALGLRHESMLKQLLITAVMYYALAFPAHRLLTPRVGYTDTTVFAGQLLPLLIPHMIVQRSRPGHALLHLTPSIAHLTYQQFVTQAHVRAASAPKQFVNLAEETADLMIRNRVVLSRLVHYFPPQVMYHVHAVCDFATQPSTPARDFVHRIGQHYPQFVPQARALEPTLRLMVHRDTAHTHSLVEFQEEATDLNKLDAYIFEETMRVKGRKNFYLLDAPPRFQDWASFTGIVTHWGHDMSTNRVMLDAYRNSSEWRHHVADARLPDFPSNMHPLQLCLLRVFENGIQGQRTPELQFPDFHPKHVFHQRPPNLPAAMETIIVLLHFARSSMKALLTAYDYQSLNLIFQPSFTRYHQERVQSSYSYFSTSLDHYYEEKMLTPYNRATKQFGFFQPLLLQHVHTSLRAVQALAHDGAFERSTQQEALLFHLRHLQLSPVHTLCATTHEMQDDIYLKVATHFIPPKLIQMAHSMRHLSPFFLFLFHQWQPLMHILDDESGVQSAYNTAYSASVFPQDNIDSLRGLIYHILKKNPTILFPASGRRWFEEFGPDYHTKQKTLRSIHAQFPSLFWGNLENRFFEYLKQPGSPVVHNAMHQLARNGRDILRIADADVAQFFDVLYLWVFMAPKKMPQLLCPLRDLAGILSEVFPTMRDHSLALSAYVDILFSSSLPTATCRALGKEEGDVGYQETTVID